MGRHGQIASSDGILPSSGIVTNWMALRTRPSDLVRSPPGCQQSGSDPHGRTVATPDLCRSCRYSYRQWWV